ncbi:MAG TPA: hypothetical protein VHE33_11875 [Acidobacteriaceae bacterium]|nr:hypothetical protein [Acidobacteriaceae bacterium]
MLLLGKGRRAHFARLRALRVMPSQPNLVSPAPSPSASPAVTGGPPEQRQTDDRSTHWLIRADLFLRVIVQLYVGIALVFLPWMHAWLYNRFFLYYAPVARVMEHGAVRGLVSGLGLLNLWIAISEAIRYKES